MTRNQRFSYRLFAWIMANVGFLILQRREGWLVAFAVSFMVGSARALARADTEKILEERANGLSK